MVLVMTLADMAKGLNQVFWQGKGKPDKKLPPGFFITDQQAIPCPEEIIAELPPGFGVIFRDYDHPARAELGNKLAGLCRRRGLVFLVAADVILAGCLEADGIHLPEAMTDQVSRIRQGHPDRIITLSCHAPASVSQASSLPLDAMVIAPVFPTQSHPETYSGARATLGLSGVVDITSRTTLPLYGLGGITVDNIHELSGTGLAGIAAIRGFGAQKP